MYQQYPLDTSLQEMLDWQADEVAKMRLANPKPSSGTFAADVHAYLQRVDIQKMPTHKERAQHLAEWVAIFGTRRRQSIGAAEIEAQRDQWFHVSRGMDTKGNSLPPYSAASVNKRLRALSNLWTKLDGRRAPNPVSDVEECEEPDPQPRALPYDVIQAIIDAIPDTYIGKKKTGEFTTGKGIPRPSENKVRLRIIAYTGLAHGQLMKLTPADVDLESEPPTIRVKARRKGKRVRRAADKPLPELLPLIPQAVDAFRDFARMDLWGAFSPSSMWKAFQRACRKLELKGIRPYDFRHSYLTEVYDATRDLRVTGKFGSHRSERTTKRYTVTAVAPHVAEAAAKVRARFAGATMGAKDDKGQSNQ